MTQPGLNKHKTRIKPGQKKMVIGHESAHRHSRGACEALEKGQADFVLANVDKCSGFHRSRQDCAGGRDSVRDRE